jgi:phosphoribosyl 1,2-cyclic phosphodiesterase
MHAAIALRILASGSRGNAAILSLRPRDAAPRHLVIDLGLSPRRLCAALAAERIAPEEVAGVLLTHADADHLHPGYGQRWPFENAMVVARAAHHRAAARGGVPARRLTDAQGPLPAAAVGVSSVALPHDEAGSTGFRVDVDGAALGWATDLGHVPASALDFFAGVDALCIESNYDLELQRRSTRPEFLKRRIMDGRGHLSNHQTLEAALHLHRARPLRPIVLLHLSQQCNDAELVRRLWSERAPALCGDLLVASQEQPLQWIRVGPPREAAIAESLFADAG